MGTKQNMKSCLGKSKFIQVFIIALFIGMSFASGTHFDGKTISEDTITFFLFYESDPAERSNHEIVSSWYKEPIRWQEVLISQEIFDISKQNKDDMIQLNVFDDRILTGTITNVIEYIPGTKTIFGSVDDEIYGTFVIAITDESCLVTIRIPGENQLFITQFDSVNNVHYSIELDLNLYQDEPRIGPLPPPDEEKPSTQYPTGSYEDNIVDMAASSSQTNTHIDVMIVYSSAAKNWADQAGGGIENVVSTALANSQIVLDNSQTQVTLNLVYSGIVDYEESGDNGLDLNRLTFKNDGFMDEVHEWRDQYGADLVKLLTRSGNYGGVAWMPRTAQGSSDLGFSLTRIHLAATTYTMIHEMGHNMGCHHHKDQNFQPGPGVFSYSAGWRWTGDDSSRHPYYCTVMTYTSGMYFEDGRTHSQVPYFSNPNVYYDEFSVGHPAHGDNARTIREMRQVIAGYRAETGIVTDIGGPYLSQTGEVVQFNATVYGGTEPYTWEWDFGDGSVSNISNPVHTYEYVGNYSITLTITDADGKKSMDWGMVNIFGISSLLCNGFLRMRRVRQGWRTSNSFTLANVGDPGSGLDWEILSYPDRGTWTFRPSGGTGLTPEDGEISVKVTMIVPTSDRFFEWFRDEIVIQNKNDPTETFVIPVSMIILPRLSDLFDFA
jgi:hypothetical protein